MARLKREDTCNTETGDTSNSEAINSDLVLQSHEDCSVQILLSKIITLCL